MPFSSVAARRVWILGVAAMLITISGVLFLSPASAEPKQEEPLADLLRAVLDKQVEDWNRGDIEGFMQAYWKDEGLTFSSGGRTTRGWKAARDRYFKAYPDRETMGKLTFSKLEVTPLGEDAALMLGRWRLEWGEPVGGNFSLVWRRVDGKWVIIHDHTSAGEEPEGEAAKE